MKKTCTFEYTLYLIHDVVYLNIWIFFLFLPINHYLSCQSSQSVSQIRQSVTEPVNQIAKQSPGIFTLEATQCHRKHVSLNFFVWILILSLHSPEGVVICLSLYESICVSTVPFSYFNLLQQCCNILFLFLFVANFFGVVNVVPVLVSLTWLFK